MFSEHSLSLTGREGWGMDIFGVLLLPRTQRGSERHTVQPWGSACRWCPEDTISDRSLLWISLEHSTEEIIQRDQGYTWWLKGGTLVYGGLDCIDQVTRFLKPSAGFPPPLRMKAGLGGARGPSHLAFSAFPTAWYSSPLPLPRGPQTTAKFCEFMYCWWPRSCCAGRAGGSDRGHRAHKFGGDLIAGNRGLAAHPRRNVFGHLLTIFFFFCQENKAMCLGVLKPPTALTPLITTLVPT